MKYARFMFLLAMVPVSTMATTFLGLQQQPLECYDTSLHFKLLLWGPIVEELVFRAGLQKLLLRQKLPHITANSVVSGIFSLAHYVLSGNPAMLAVFAPSLLLGWVYQKTDSLVWIIGLHSFFNLLFLAGMCWF
jgi:membrane protease YdiL (CAAX protease family)